MANVEDIVDWLGEMDEAHNVTDHTDEATTVITIDVETLAARISDLMDDWADGTWPGMPKHYTWQRVRTRTAPADLGDPTPHVVPWKAGDTVYGVKLDDGQWEYRPKPFTVGVIVATPYTVSERGGE